MKPIRSKILFHVFTLLTVLTVLLGSQPALPARADERITPLIINGGFTWAKAIDGTAIVLNDDVVTDATGSVYMIGQFTGTADFDPGPGTLNIVSAGDYDVYVVKLDSSGALLWAKTMGGTLQEEGGKIALDPYGNVLTTGYFKGTADFDPSPSTYTLSAAGADKEIFVSKLDGNGNFVWARAMGGAGDDAGNAITTDALGYVYTTGTFQGTADFDPGAGTYNLVHSTGTKAGFISKLSSSGTFIWARSMEAASDFSFYAVLVDSNYDVYTTGQFDGTTDLDPGAGVHNLSGFGSFLSHLDTNGNFVHADGFTGTGGSIGNALALDPNGEVYVAGSFYNTLTIGAAFPLYSAGGFDGFIAKTDGQGNFNWAKSIGGLGADSIADIATDSSGEVYSTGWFADTADFDPGPGVFNMTTSFADSNIFVLRLNQSGDFVWAKGLGGNYYEIGRGIALSPNGDVNTVGFFSGPADFDPGAGVYNLTPSGVDSAFISKLSNDIAPVVSSIIRLDTTPTTAATVDFLVTFSESVSGVDTVGPVFDNFSPFITQYITNAAVTNVTGSADTYVVTVKTGQGSGTLRLDAAASGSIIDLAAQPMARGFTGGELYTINKVPTFVDVPFSYWASSYIERLYSAGITSGCSVVPSNFCPLTTVTRAQMAIFLVRGVHGVGFTPPAATGIFSDVPVGSFGANYIEQLSADGITSGCGGGKFCPNQIVTRSQLAIFLVRAKHGVAFVPATALGVFTDVPVGSFGADYIEQLVKDGITSGCTPTTYCPSTTVKRDSMSVLLVRTFDLP